LGERLTVGIGAGEATKVCAITLAHQLRSGSKKAARHLKPLLAEFEDKVRFKWYDTEFYNARVTDVWVLEAQDHLSRQMFCEKLSETPFWDRYFQVEEISDVRPAVGKPSCPVPYRRNRIGGRVAWWLGTLEVC
jgi:Darcynin, domain of unknown function